MSLNLTSIEMLSLVSGSSVAAAAIGAWATRKAARAGMEISKFEAITNALDARIKDLKEELDLVKRDLNRLRSEYESEVDKHHRTRSHLAAAISHIKEWLNWAVRGDMGAPHPKIPTELGDLI